MIQFPAERRFFIRAFVLSPAVINLLLNGLVAWLVYRGRTAVPLWGAQGLSLDLLLTFFLITFLTSLIVTPLVAILLRQGDLSTVTWSRQKFGWLAWLPAGRWGRALAAGAAAALLMGGGLALMLLVAGLDEMAPAAAVTVKALGSALLAALITSALALAALADASQARIAQLGYAPPAIPIAQLAPGSTGGHVRAMQEDMIGYLETIGAQGPLLRIPLFGPVYAYFVNDPELVRQVLVKQAGAFHKPANVKRAARALQIENVFTADGELWRELRTAMQPAFHARRIENYGGIMTAATEQMLAGWNDGQRVDIPAAMMDLTLGITTRALFGRDMRDAEAGAAIVRFIELFYGRISSFPLPAWLPTRSGREMERQIGIIEDWLAPMIAERQATAEPFDDVLSMLIEAQKADTSGLLTDHQVRTEVMNLFAAGYEVVANTLAFTLYLVSQHPQVEKRIQAELDEVLGGEPLSLETLRALPYVEMTLKESMRLLPVTTVLTRQTAEAVQLGGYLLPKNRLVLFSPWVLQRAEAAFPEPLHFRPERFDAQHGQEIPRYAYLPFSNGPRVCLGNTFAMMQMTINLATIWQQVSLRHAPDHVFEPIYSFNTRPQNGLPMIVQRRVVNPRY